MFLAYLFEHGDVGRVTDLAVEVDDEFEFADRAVQLAVRPVDHRDVVPGGCFAGAVADLPHGGQRLLVVNQGLLPVTQLVVHAADVVEGDRFAGAVADLPPDG